LNIYQENKIITEKKKNTFIRETSNLYHWKYNKKKVKKKRFKKK